jgi:hypothetical protein
MYGKIENGELKKAPLQLENVPRPFPPAEEGGEPVTMLCTVTNPTAQQYAAAGYLPVYDTPPAEPAGEGKHYEKRGWAEGVDKEGDPAILRTWAIVDDPDPMEEEIDAERAIGIILKGRDPYDAA